MRCALFVALLASQAAWAADPGSKSAAVNKVIELLEGLQSKVLEEGEAQAKSYNQFACWCKATMQEKSDDIADAQRSIDTLTGRIEDATEARSEADTAISELTEEITELTHDMHEQKEQWQELVDKYHATEHDILKGQGMLDGAIKELGAGCDQHGSASFLQVPETSRQAVQGAVLLADALGVPVSKSRKFESFLQIMDKQPAASQYDCHSQDEIDLLMGLLNSFHKKETEVENAEKGDHFKFETEIQRLHSEIEAKNRLLEQEKEESGQQMSSLQADSQERTELNANLMTDNKFLAATAKDCEQAATTWDEIQKTRVGELQALTEAINIIKTTVAEKTSGNTIRFAQTGVSQKRMAIAVARDPAMMEQLEADVEGFAPVLLSLNSQTMRVKVHSSAPAKEAASVLVDMLRSKRSTVLASIANQVENVDMNNADPFAKIKQLIEELVKRLLAEAANEANQKGWCDKETMSSNQKRDQASRKMGDLNAQMSKEEADISKFTELIDTTSEKLANLQSEVSNATDMREKESAENTATVQEAELGREALQMAYDVLKKFYDAQAKKADTDISLAAVDPRPDAGFKNGETYRGGQGAAGGIMGMMDVIKSDFTRTIEETKKAEDLAKADYREFMTASQMSIAEMEVLLDSTKTELKETRDSYEANSNTLEEQSDLLGKAIEQLMELQKTCVDTGMSYEERVAAREDEITSLKKGLCILENQDQGANAAEEC